MAGKDWLIYGANGYTGRMMAEEAVRQRPAADPRRPQRRRDRAAGEETETAGARVRARQPDRGARRPEQHRPGAALRRAVLGDQRADARGLPGHQARITSTSPARSTCSRMPCAARPRAQGRHRGPARRRLRRRADRLPGGACSSASCPTPRPWCWPSMPAAAPARAPPRPASKAWARAAARASTANCSGCRWPGRRAPSSATATRASP